MARRKFDRYMIELGAGTHPKFAGLSPAERCAHFLGVLAVAARSPIRGYLIVGDKPATAAQVAAVAGVRVSVAESAMVKLRERHVIESMPESDYEHVHDWEDVNPPPKRDNTRNQRQERWRNTHRNDPSNAPSNAVTNGEVTLAEVEVEVEVEELPLTQQPPLTDRPRASARQRVDQERFPDQLSNEQRCVADEALRVLAAVHDERGGQVPTKRGVGLAVARFPDRDHLAVVRELEHWALAGNGQRTAVKDWARTYATFLDRTVPGSPTKFGQDAGKDNASSMLRAMGFRREDQT